MKFSRAIYLFSISWFCLIILNVVNFVALGYWWFTWGIKRGFGNCWDWWFVCPFSMLTPHICFYFPFSALSFWLLSWYINLLILWFLLFVAARLFCTVGVHPTRCSVSCSSYQVFHCIAIWINMWTWEYMILDCLSMFQEFDESGDPEKHFQALLSLAKEGIEKGKVCIGVMYGYIPTCLKLVWLKVPPLFVVLFLYFLGQKLPLSYQCSTTMLFHVAINALPAYSISPNYYDFIYINT